MLLAVCHSSVSGWVEVEDLERLSDLRAETGNVLWAEADTRTLTADDVSIIAAEFDLHPLAVEDAVTRRQRPKVELYDTHAFVVIHELHEENGQLEAAQLACFIGKGYVLTIHHGAARTIERAKDRWRALESGGQQTPARLVHTLLDVIVDAHQEAADKLENEVEELEELVLADPGVAVQRQLYSVKQRIARLRRYALPVGRVVEELRTHTGDEAVLSDVMDPEFRDVEDHTLRITEQIRQVDDLSQAVLDLVRAEHSQVLNENNRKLSAWAAIFAVATVIAGIYGMNFRLVPADATLFGFWFAISLIFGSSIGLYLYFKQRGWL